MLGCFFLLRRLPEKSGSLYFFVFIIYTKNMGDYRGYS